jgi:hypothetical protein
MVHLNITLDEDLYRQLEAKAPAKKLSAYHGGPGWQDGRHRGRRNGRIGGSSGRHGGLPGGPSTNPCSRPDSPNPENPCSGLGIYDECLPHGQSFDRRFASDPCCEGLSLVPFDLLQDPTSTGHPLPGLATSTDAMSSKGSKPCKPVYEEHRSGPR